MESVSNRAAVRASAKAVIVGLVSLSLASLASPAQAGRRFTTSNADSGDHGVNYSIRAVDRESGEAIATSSGVECNYQLQFGNIGATSGYWKRAPSKTSVLAHRTCTDGTDDFVWVDACGFVDLGRMCASGSPQRVDPVALAREVRDSLPVADLQISMNPRRGLVGVKSWFWIEGGGRPLSDSLWAFGVRVDVEARPTSYRWDFGDGTVITTKSPGRPYPDRSPVRHTYEQSSARHPDGYRVTVTTLFDVRWRANGGRWRTLDGITRLSERLYRVAESQAVNSDG